MVLLLLLVVSSLVGIVMVFLPHWPKQTKLNTQIILGTERVERALKYLGDPHLRVPPVIYVAGTNGKGSTVSYMVRILEESGYRVHSFTSPHLIDFNERIVLSGQKISDDHLFSIMEECRIMVETHSVLLTLFEATTVAAFLAFANTPADFLVLEIGMGGRSDATNVIANPFLSIVTSISFDHQEFLGDTLPAIAFEKAGIIKPHAPCVVGRQSSEEVVALLDAYATTMESPKMIYGKNWSCERSGEDKLSFFADGRSLDFPLPSLLGEHQIENAGNAIAGSLLLNSVHGVGISNDQIAAALKSTYWPARLELITSNVVRRDMPDGWNLYLDGAHNTGGAIALAQWAKQNAEVPLYLVLGMTKGKNVEEFLAVLKPHVTFVCGVCVQRELHAQRGVVISSYAKGLGIPTEAFDYLPSALDYIAEHESRDRVNILICGSLYLASDIKRMEQGVLL